MRRALWPSEDNHGQASEEDADKWLLRSDAVVFIAERSDIAGLAGFAEAGERQYADGCTDSPVAFLEAWYVDPDLRLLHVGAALIKAVERWAQERGFKQLASDALLENVQAHQAHVGVGFEEVERSVKFIKSI